MELPKKNITDKTKIDDSILQHARSQSSEKQTSAEPAPRYVNSHVRKTSQRVLDARANFLSSLLYSLGLLALGGIVTGITYAVADDGGTYIVTTGLFVMGGLYFCVAIWHLLKWAYFALND